MTDRDREKDRYARIPGRAWRSDPYARLSLAAFGLMMRTWSFAADGMTDGVIPAHELPSVAKGPVPKKLVDELVRAGIWFRTKGGYRCALYLGENISRKDWETRKADQNRRKKKSRGDPSQGGHGDGHASGHGDVTRDVTRDPLTQDAGRRTQDAGHAHSDARARDPGGPSDGEILKLWFDRYAVRYDLAFDDDPWVDATVGPKQRELLLEQARARATSLEEHDSLAERVLEVFFANEAERLKGFDWWRLCGDLGRWVGASSRANGARSKARRQTLEDAIERTRVAVPPNGGTSA